MKYHLIINIAVKYPCGRSRSRKARRFRTFCPSNGRRYHCYDKQRLLPVECTGGVCRRRRTQNPTKRYLLFWLCLPRGTYQSPYRINFIANTLVEAHTGKPPFCTIPTEFTVVVRIMNGERPCWPTAPAGGHDVSTGVRELSERCWSSDPAKRPTAQAIVEALALEISQDTAMPQVLQPPQPISSTISASSLQEASKKPINLSHYAITRDRVSRITEAGHRINDRSGTSRLLKRLTSY
jgi:hypothetical protein